MDAEEAESVLLDPSFVPDQWHSQGGLEGHFPPFFPEIYYFLPPNVNLPRQNDRWDFERAFMLDSRYGINRYVLYHYVAIATYVRYFTRYT